MGWEVVAHVYIDFKDKVGIETINKIMQILNITHADYNDFRQDDYEIFFELSGNKGINYECLDKIKEELKQIIKSISANEYIEGDCGYYYNAEDEENEKRKPTGKNKKI